MLLIKSQLCISAKLLNTVRQMKCSRSQPTPTHKLCCRLARFLMSILNVNVNVLFCEETFQVRPDPTLVANLQTVALLVPMTNAARASLRYCKICRQSIKLLAITQRNKSVDISRSFKFGSAFTSFWDSPSIRRGEQISRLYSP